jgi:opacity protein-like surface antigen
MSGINRILVSGAVALVLGLPVAASAADSGFYVGALVGSSNVDLSKADWDAAVLDALNTVGTGGVLTSSSLDKSDIGFGAVLGWKFMPNFAVEAYYLDLGKVKADATGTTIIGNPTFDVTLSGEFKTNGPAVALVGILPFSQNWEADARAGIYYGDTKITLTATVAGGGGTASSSDSQSRSSFMGGIGVGYLFNENVSVRLDYMYFDSVGIKRSGIDDTANVNLISLGVRYMF